MEDGRKETGETGVQGQGEGRVGVGGGVGVEVWEAVVVRAKESGSRACILLPRAQTCRVYCLPPGYIYDL